jgi:Halobacterial output domain 1
MTHEEDETRRVEADNEYPAYTDRVSTAVVHAITRADGCTQAEIPPLYETIDPDALDALYAHRALTVQFEYAGHHVTITPDERISLGTND